MKQTKLISIVIISHQHERFLDDLLESLLENQLDNQFQVLLVHNCISDYQMNIKPNDSFTISSIHNAKPLSLAVNLNRSIDKCMGDYILIINPDTYLPKRNIHKNIEYLKANELDLVSCPSFHPKGQQLINLRYFPRIHQILLDNLLPTNNRHQEQKLISLQQKPSTFWFQGSYLLCNAKVFDQVRFQEKYFLYFEDVQFCWDLWSKGYNLGFNQNTFYSHYFQQHSATHLKYKLHHINSYLHYFFS